MLNNKSDPISEIDYDEEELDAEEKFVRSRIPKNISKGLKIKRIAFWIFYIMAFYFFASNIGNNATSDSAYLKFLTLNGKLLFLPGLLILVVCANIAGPIAGGIGAFLGDLIYQIVTIKTVQTEFLLTATLIGVGAGLFRFNKDTTLKQMAVMKLFYSLVGTVTVSLGILFLVGWIRNPALNWDSELGTSLQSAYTQFLFSEIISFLFVGPLVIALIDRILRWTSNPEGIAYKFFFTHHYKEQADHAIPLNFGGYQFFVCTRCSGTVSGILFMVFVDYALLEFNGFEIISPTVAFILSIVFTLPALVDWGTQKLLLRTSNNLIRLISGMFLGAAIHLLVLAVEQYVLGVIIILVVFFGAFFVMFFLGNQKLRRFIMKRVNKSVRDDEDSSK